MIRRCAWLQWILTVYVWLMVAVPLGHWNIHGGPYLLPSLLHGRWPGERDTVVIALVTVLALIFWAGYKRGSFVLVLIALTMDTVWFCGQLIFFGIPYALGEGYRLQRIYALYPRTQILPSFEGHYAPDGMTTVTGVLLVLVFCMGIAALFELRQRRRRAIL